MIRIAVFASGSGTNAENLIQYFANNKEIQIHMIFTNNPKAGVIDRAHKLKTPCNVLSRSEFDNNDGMLKRLKAAAIDYIILAGFLILIPQNIIQKFKGRIINIHPALLPLHGGKGFYGKNVHQSVIDSGTMISGITIHHVNENFDDGEIIFQAACHVSKNETAETLAEKIHKLEYAWFPVVLEKLILNPENK